MHRGPTAGCTERDQVPNGIEEATNERDAVAPPEAIAKNNICTILLYGFQKCRNIVEAEPAFINGIGFVVKTTREVPEENGFADAYIASSSGA